MRKQRNIYCKSYDRCLDWAARAGKTFSCEGCEHEGDRYTQELDPHDLQSCLNLIRVIFKDGPRRGAREKDKGGLQVMVFGSIGSVTPRVD